VILGKQAIDDDANQTGQMLAALLGWAQGTFASKVEVDGETVNVTREVDGGLETLQLKLPAIVHHRSSPQRAALRLAAQHHEGEIQAARQKTPADYGVDIAPRLTTIHVREPSKREAGVKLKSVDELIDHLRTKGVVG
jgi:electron transfer flavoprotein beta subunit